MYSVGINALKCDQSYGLNEVYSCFQGLKQTTQFTLWEKIKTRHYSGLCHSGFISYYLVTVDTCCDEINIVSKVLFITLNNEENMLHCEKHNIQNSTQFRYVYVKDT